MAVGPFTPGFVADQGLASQLAEIGVSLLMFGVGLHFSIRDLLAVRSIAIPGALAQIAVATVLGALVGRSWGWSWGEGLVFGLSLSVASTVVLLRALGEQGQLETVNGRIAVGWLIVEDLAMVFALVALPTVALTAHGGGAQGSGALGPILLSLVKVGAFVAAMLMVGKVVLPRALGRVARSGHRELLTIGILAIALGIAFGAAALFGISPALGAFFAGLIIGETDISHQASAETLPLQEMFVVLFFVSVGMLFDPSILVQDPLKVLAAVLIVLLGKSLAAAAIVSYFRYPVSTALTISASLAQIGEFSFILVALSIQLKLVRSDAMSIVVATAILSIGLNPLIFRTVEPIGRWLRGRERLLRILERAPMNSGLDALAAHVPEISGHVAIVGYGRVGATVGRALSHCGIPFSVVEMDAEVVHRLREAGVATVFGDASRPGILQSAGVRAARLLVLAAPGWSQAREIVSMARRLNPDIEICVRSHSYDENESFRQIGIDRVVMGEEELALQMSRFALQALGAPQERLESVVEGLRTTAATS